MAKIHLFLSVMVAALGVTLAATDDERNTLKEAVLPWVVACRDEIGVPPEALSKVKENKDFASIDPCFYACVFKKLGFITDAGLYDADAAMEHNKKYFKGENDVKTFNDVCKTCTTVNAQSVSDGFKGCDRAKLLLACIMKEKANFSPYAS